MRVTRKEISDIILPILEIGAVKVIKFYDEKIKIKATRKLFGKRINKRFKYIEILLTIGPPNFRERIMIKNALKKDKLFLRNKSLVIFPYKIKRRN